MHDPHELASRALFANLVHQCTDLVHSQRVGVWQLSRTLKHGKWGDALQRQAIALLQNHKAIVR